MLSPSGVFNAFGRPIQYNIMTAFAIPLTWVYIKTSRITRLYVGALCILYRAYLLIVLFFTFQVMVIP